MKLFNISAALTLLLLGTATATPVWNKPVKRAIANLPTSEVDCGGQKFNDFQIEDAAQRGVDNGLDPTGPQPGGYPKEFKNKENFAFPNCPPEGGTLIEFPIMKDGRIYGGGRPYEYRVIFQATDPGNGRYCGLIYHPPGDDTGFDQCKDT